MGPQRRRGRRRRARPRRAARRLNLTDGETRWNAFVGAFAAALGREVVWRDRSTVTLLTHSNDNPFQYLVTTGHFGAHFPNDRLLAAFPGLTFADWREGVREAVDAYRARHSAAESPSKRP